MRIDAGTGNIPVEARSRDQSRLVDAAQQFEAMLLQEMLKPLHSSENKWDAPDADKSADTLSSYGAETMAKAISKSGGLGIAKRVIHEVCIEQNKMRKGTT